VLACVSTLPLAAASFAAEPVPVEPMLKAHNEVRSRHDLPSLTWSETLAKDAAEWADYLAKEESCRLLHSKDDTQGENLFWASAVTWSDGRKEVQSVTPAQVVKSWASEEADYDYGRNRCRAGKACGHYTQIVWKRTTEMGCARSTCPDLAQVWVCRYRPPGNWIGQRPY
jgi:pathogenesis-related protein 1